MLEFIRAAIATYVLLPIFAFYYSINGALGKNVDPKDEVDVFGYFYCSQEIVCSGLFLEHVGEAAPQIALSVIFMANNYCSDLLTYNLFGIEIPTTIVSVCFSAGSLIIGIIRGLPHIVSYITAEAEFQQTFKKYGRVISALQGTENGFV